MHSMSKAPLVIGCTDRDDLDLDHPAFNNHANCKFNGLRWDSVNGLRLDEAAARMSMITEYATFHPSSEFRAIVNAAANATGMDYPDGADYYGYIHGTEAQRDLTLACMGL
jgi:hypothetical protein